MKTILKSIAAGAAMLGLAMTGAAQADGTSPAFPFAATGFVAGGGAFLEPSGDFLCIAPGACDNDIALIVAGGDMVIPVTGYWNIQLGGAFHTSHQHFSFGGSDSLTQFQGSGIGFWRDPMTGVFGIEAGLVSPWGRDSRLNYVKLGAVGEYFWGDAATISVFGGALIPVDPTPFGPAGNFEEQTGWYTGGHLTWYASSNMALAAVGQYMQFRDESFFSEADQNSLFIGGKVRYLTNMPGIELFGSAGYRSCWFDETVRGRASTGINDGVEVMAGINIRLGGRDSSLVDIDRSNAIDTRVWNCGSGVGVN
jgi:opacity protein-like surface antigen